MSKVKSVSLLLAGALLGSVVTPLAVEASTPKPSGYCSIKERGQKRWYVSPSKKSKYWLKCTVVPTQKWKKA